jgi:DNA-binding XRE family transcriptional regulator
VWIVKGTCTCAPRNIAAVRVKESDRYVETVEGSPRRGHGVCARLQLRFLAGAYLSDVIALTMPTRLRYWRERRGLTQMQLAQLSTVGVATVRRIEADRDRYLGTIEKLAKALRIKPWHLIDWSASITDPVSGGRSESN